MKLIYLLVILYFPLRSVAQKEKDFKFIVANKVIVDSATGLYEGSSFEFSYTRFVYKDSCFKEVGLFAKKQSITFKIKNGLWFIRQNGRWDLFYSPYKSVIPKLKINNQLFFLRPRKNITINGVFCVVYDAVPVNSNVSGNIEYWFNPSFGIVKIKTEEVDLIRDDFSKAL